MEGYGRVRRDKANSYQFNYAENKARELGLQELIALSTQAFTYFQSKGGFSEGTPDDLPPARREKYEQSGRKSKVLVKKLAKPSGAEPPPCTAIQVGLNTDRTSSDTALGRDRQRGRTTSARTVNPTTSCEYA